MTTTDWNSFEIDREEIVVTSFTLLGSEIEKEGRCDSEIKPGVAIEKANPRKDMARQTREHTNEKRIVRSLIFPTVLYGCETWTMTKKMEKKMHTCEMWIWRKMQRISW